MKDAALRCDIGVPRLFSLQSDSLHLPIRYAEVQVVILLGTPREEADVQLLTGIQSDIHGQGEMLCPLGGLLTLAQVGARIEIFAVSASHSVGNSSLHCEGEIA